MQVWGRILGVLGLVALPGLAEAQAICREDARAVTLSASFGMESGTSDLVAAVLARADRKIVAPVWYEVTDLPWPAVLAEQRATLPPDLADLPLLALLARIEADGTAATMVMAMGNAGVLIPEMPALLRRHGLESRATAFEALLAEFPDWSPGATTRDAVLARMGDSSAMTPGGSGLYAAFFDYPQDDATRWAAYRLGLKDPAQRAAWQARARSASPAERLDWLEARLRRDCGWLGWWEPETGQALLARQGRAQDQIMLISDYLFISAGAGLGGYLYASQAALAPELALVLEERGLRDEAERLRDGMELFGNPFPRATEDRETVVLADPPLITEIDRLENRLRWFSPRSTAETPQTDIFAPLPQQDVAALRAEMLKIATEAGLLPR